MDDGARIRHREGWTGTVASPCNTGRHGRCFLVTPDGMPPYLATHIAATEIRVDEGVVWAPPPRPVCGYCKKPATSTQGGHWCCGRPACDKWGEQMRPIYKGEQISAGVRG